MNQIAGADGFNVMNNLRLVVIVAIFIILIIVLFYNRILGFLKSAKQEDKQPVNSSDGSSREEREASDVVGDFFGEEESAEKAKSKVDESAAEPEEEIEDQAAGDSNREELDASGALGDFFGIEESEEKEISKGGESAVESEMVIEGQPVVNYEKIEADLKSVRDEVTAKIETDLKAVEGDITAKIEADLKSVGDEVTTKIEGLILKVAAVEKEVLNKIEDVIDAKIQEASNKINDGISEAVRTQIDSINPVAEEREDSLHKEEVPEGMPEGGIGGSVDSDMQNVLTEEPVGMPSTEVPKELVEEKVESEEKEERDLQALVKNRDFMEKLHLFVRYQLDAFEIIPFDEAKAVAEVKKDVKVDKKESIDATTSTGKIEEKKSTGAIEESVGPARLFFQKFLSVGIPSTEEPKGSVGEKVEFKEKRSAGAAEESVGPAKAFFKKFLSAGKPSTEEPKELVEEKVESEKKKEGGLGTSVEDRDILEKLAGSLQMDEDSFDILPSEKSKTVSEEKKEKGLEVPSEVKEDVKVDEKEPVESITSTGEVEEKISAGGSSDFDIEKFLEEAPVGMSSTEEPKESVGERVELKEEIEIDLEVPSEVKEDVKAEEKEPVESITSTEEVEEKISAGESDDFDIEKFLEKEPVGMSTTEEFKELVKEVEYEEKKERDLEVPSEVKEDVKVDEKEPIESIASAGEVEGKPSEGDVGESDGFDIEKFLEKDPVGVSPTEESGEVVEEKFELKLEEEKEEDLELPAEEAAAHEEIEEKEIGTIAPPGDIEEKTLESDKGEGAEEKKQSTVETSDFDIQEFLEELGTPPSEKDLESEKE